MFWVRAQFKDRCKVWASSDESGEFQVQAGKVPIKYNLAGKRYDAAAVSLQPIKGAKIVPNEEADSQPQDQRTADRGPYYAKATKGRQRTEEPKHNEPRTTVSGRRRTKSLAQGQRTEGRVSGVEPVVVYTDGSSLGNPGPAGCGVLMTYKDREKHVSRYLGTGTNNVAELEGVRVALKLMKDRTVPVDIYTDSTYVIGVLQKNWKAKENVELIESIRELLGKFDDVKLIKVKGHAGIGPNETVDELARQAATNKRSTTKTKKIKG